MPIKELIFSPQVVNKERKQLIKEINKIEHGQAKIDHHSPKTNKQTSFDPLNRQLKFGQSEKSLKENKDLKNSPNEKPTETTINKKLSLNDFSMPINFYDLVIQKGTLKQTINVEPYHHHNAYSKTKQEEEKSLSLKKQSTIFQERDTQIKSIEKNYIIPDKNFGQSDDIPQFKISSRLKDLASKFALI